MKNQNQKGIASTLAILIVIIVGIIAIGGVLAYQYYWTPGEEVEEEEKAEEPYIIVISPNGGEVLVSGEKGVIKVYCSQAISKTLNIWLMTPGIEGDVIMGGIASGVTCRSGTTSLYEWNIPSISSAVGPVPQFKVKVQTIDGVIFDESDNYFSIVEE